MVHLILTGGTGLVGSAVLSHVLSLLATSQPAITRLSILSRTPAHPLLSSTPPAGTPNVNKHTKIEIIEHKDFSTYPPELLEKLKGADACIWALGISQNAVSEAEYVHITKDYALAAAKAFAGLKTQPAAPNTSGSGGSDAEKFKFVFVSGAGATFKPRAWTPLFGRVKGETEQALLSLARSAPYKDMLSVYSVRPAAVDGHNQPWIWGPVLSDKRSWFQRTYLRVLMYPIRSGWAGTGSHSPTENLGRVLVEMACDEAKGPYSITRVGKEGLDEGEEGEGRVLGNKGLRWLGGLK